MQDGKTLVIVPAFNESGNIGRTINEINGCGLPVDILVVDDGSSDSTAAQARSAGAAKVISLPFNLGIGGAVQTGFIYAREYGYDLAAQIDGDGQHNPAFLKDLLGPIAQGRADLVIGSRFLPPYLSYRSSFVRRLGINFFAKLISDLTGYQITDSTSGFRAFNRKAILTFAASYPQDYPEPESIMTARKVNLRVLEVPVEMRKRQAGKSSIRYITTLYYMIKVTLAIILNTLRPVPHLKDFKSGG